MSDEYGYPSEPLGADEPVAAESGSYADPVASNADPDFGPPPPPVVEVPSRRVLHQAVREHAAGVENPLGLEFDAPVTETRMPVTESVAAELPSVVTEVDREVTQVIEPPTVSIQPTGNPAASRYEAPIRQVQQPAQAIMTPVAQPNYYPSNYQDPAYRQPPYQGANYPGMVHAGQNPVHYVSVPPRRHSVFPAALTAALIGALLASGLTAAVMHTQNASLRQTAVPVITNTDPGRVDEPLVTSAAGSQPAWQDVISTVQDSVVAITAETPMGSSVGSGFVLDTNGRVLTNNHVVAGAIDNRVEVTLADGRLYMSQILGTDSVTDLALLQLEDVPPDLHPASLGDSDQVRVGDAVLAVGNPLGLSNTATTGIVSALDRPVTAGGSGDLQRTTTNAIQIDAAVNPGNSGGPVFDSTGRVIGVASSIANLQGAGNQGSIGLGFAIPINLVKNITEQLVTQGSAQHALMGVLIEPGTATADGTTRRGARISQVNPGSPAQQAGLQVGDVIIAVNNRPVNSHESVTAIVREHRAGDTIAVTLVRNGQIQQASVTLAAMPQDDQDQIQVTPDLTDPNPEIVNPTPEFVPTPELAPTE